MPVEVLFSRFAGGLGYVLLERQRLLVSHNRTEVVPLAHVCFEFYCITISSFHCIRVVYFGRLPIGRQIQSAWKEGGVVRFRVDRRFRDWLRSF
jgi:hypothetical protein